MKGIVFSHEGNTNILKISEYTKDSLKVMQEVILFDVFGNFTESAISKANELGYKLTAQLIQRGSPMDAVQNVWMELKLGEFKDNSNTNLDDLLKDSKEMTDKELKKHLRGLCPELTNDEFEKMFKK